ncbi:LacI family transcriptional regulator [Flavihumibacter rivuli]|uniref:LacI family DNA-binding transcriptional regulator n=1 Tax=Flavihumibacter rivuli TaxID=2838156 RepID=UPI001BDEB1CF|nr:LacI family DNA-binding transcriptional regulator [Flavihumibacter rivuli]ULQ56395.1 LacI family transcriptional regulator [Flavihumibacter rivuli]
MARITIKDIAKRLNINPSTVSRALRDHPDVSAQLKETIKALADKMGYKPNHLAINLRRGKSHTIGLIIPEIAQFFFPSVIKAVEEAAHDRGYNLLVLHSNDSIDREIENAEICANMGVDGILVSLSRQSTDIEHFQELEASETPIVYFDKVVPNSVAHKVVMPGEKATEIAIGHLLQTIPNPRRLVGFFADERLSISEDRIKGFNQALAAHHIQAPENNCIIVDSSEAARTTLIGLMQSDNPPDALFAMSDEILLGVVQAAYEIGFRIPDQLKVVAFSDGWLPQSIPFYIPYVKTSGYDLGKTAAGLLFELIMKMPILPDTHYIDVTLVHNRKEDQQFP